MGERTMAFSDGVTIARSVRDLARKARHALETVDEAEARDVCDEIGGLERLIEPGSADDLGRWLASLRRRVAARSRTAC